jgi:T4-like virus tail tube protein gp19
MPAREPPSLLGTAHFRVLIGRREVGFAEVGPLVSDGEPPSIVLRRALAARATELFDWRRKGDARAVTIEQLDAAGTVVNAWRLVNARPLKWTGPAFNAAATDVAIEELALVYEELVWLEPESEGGTAGGRRT